MTNIRTSDLKHPIRAVLVAAASLLLSLVALPTGSADAAPAAGEATGWIRIGHLSTGTAGVDVRLTPFAGGGPTDLTDVVYGEFSPYQRVPAGLYTVAVRPAGSGMSVQPMIDETVEVFDGAATTLVATRSGGRVVSRVIQDDLTPPADSQAKVRLISGAGDDQAVSARVVDGPLLADEVTPGSDTGYASVAARTWSIELTVDGVRSSVNQVPLQAGGIYTLLVVDAPAGTLELKAIQDSAASAVMPQGGVDTGAGALAGSDERAPGIALGGFGGLLLVGALSVMLVRRGTSGAVR